jgi:hypothetical protein
MTEDDIQQVEDSVRDAEEYLHLAVTQFIAKNRNDSDPHLMFRVLEMALLRQAARVALIMRDDLHAQFTKGFFIEEARREYADVEKYFAKKPAQKPPRKPRLKVVK